MEFTQVQRHEADAVAAFMTAEEWPFHTEPRPDGDAVRARVADGAYDDAFWIADGTGRLGLVRLLDLDDGTPLFDLRVRAAARGRGVGTTAVRWLTAHVFTNHATDRIEGTTRQDNHAMRHVFAKTGWVKEAHYRDAWPGPDLYQGGRKQAEDGDLPARGDRLLSAGLVPTGTVRDSVGYAILRRDWESGTSTPVDWSA